MQSTYIFPFEGSSPIDWCEDVGFLWILFFMTYAGFLYSFIKKPSAKILGNVFEPMVQKLEIVLSIR